MQLIYEVIIKRGNVSMLKPFHHLTRGVLIKENKVLLAQAKGYSNTFLPGGHVENGESAKDALKRELEEELGIASKIGSFLGVVEHKWEKKEIIHYEINQVFLIECEELASSYKPEANEPHLIFHWVKVDELDKYNLQPYPFRDLIKNFVNGNKEVWWESTLRAVIDDSNRN